MGAKNKYGTVETVLDIITGISMFFGLIYNLFIFVWAVLTLVFGCICKRIGKDKGIDYGFLVGWFLGVIGLIIMFVLQGDKQNTQNIDKYEELTKLQKLKENGTITEEEFIKEKNRILK